MTKKKTPSKKLTVKKQTVERLAVESEAAEIRAGNPGGPASNPTITCNTQCAQCEDKVTNSYVDCKAFNQRQ
jgi:hypothetical protein